MTLETATWIANRIRDEGWNSRIEFAMHGEPTLNPQLSEIIGLFRDRLPRAPLMLTTNGLPLQHHVLGFGWVVDMLFDSGLNVMALDDYRGLKVAPLARAYAIKHGVELHEYPEDPRGNPHRRHSVKTRMITIIRDISLNSDGTHAHLSNHAGAAAPLNDSCNGKRCALPFRELSIRWNGNVAICCNDWRGTFKVGNAVQDTLEEIWHHPAMYAARKHLLRGERVFAPCKGCDHTSYRVGLLPDRMGKETLEPASEYDDAIIAMAIDGAPYTSPVLRPWEKG
jgi:radical SAM protein with 4Fe4S-binding SPASM domain